MNKFAVLINSSDGYADCWEPFFTLFARYWPDCDAPVWIVTERRAFSTCFPNLQNAQVANPGETRVDWGEALLRSLNQIREEIILYLQEDYFFDRTVNHDVIREFVELMHARTTVKHIGLTNGGSRAPFLSYDDNRLAVVRPRAWYRISTQAGLWRRDTLQSYARSDETAWMFEIFGTLRSWSRDELFLTVEPTIEAPLWPPISYAPTGIMKGKWNPAVVELFSRHGVRVDFTQRGFHAAPPAPIRKVLTAAKLVPKLGRFFSAAAGR